MNVLPTPPRRRAVRHRRRRLHACPRTLAGCGGISRRVRAAGDPRLVHRRPHRRRLSARLLPGCDPGAPRRRAPVLERRPGHPPRARVRAPRDERPGEQGSRSGTPGTRDAGTADDHGEGAGRTAKSATAGRGNTRTRPRRERGRVARQQGTDRRRDPLVADLRARIRSSCSLRSRGSCSSRAASAGCPAAAAERPPPDR